MFSITNETYVKKMSCICRVLGPIKRKELNFHDKFQKNQFTTTSMEGILLIFSKYVTRTRLQLFSLKNLNLLVKNFIKVVHFWYTWCLPWIDGLKMCTGSSIHVVKVWPATYGTHCMWKTTQYRYSPLMCEYYYKDSPPSRWCLASIVTQTAYNHFFRSFRPKRCSMAPLLQDPA